VQVQDEAAPYDEINVTPMLDLAYVLLVIFIIMTTASVQGIKVALPKTQKIDNLAVKGVKAVTISQTGDLFLDTYPVTTEQLAQRLAELKNSNPAQSIVVKGDAHTQYAKVMEVLEMLKRADISDIGLATSRQQGAQ
jgi:biopolymer transport protein ExbD